MRQNESHLTSARRSTIVLAMPRHLIRWSVVAGLSCAVPLSAQGPAAAGQAAVSSDISAATAKFVKRDGFLPLYLDTASGKLYLELPQDSARVLAFFNLATGLGSNPVGLDRGASGPDRIVRFDRAGSRVLVV